MNEAPITLDEAERHELTCLRARVQQLSYPCSPHCDGYLREQALRNSMAWTRTASEQIADLHTANNVYLKRARAAERRERALNDALMEAMRLLRIARSAHMKMGLRDMGDRLDFSDETRMFAMEFSPYNQPDVGITKGTGAYQALCRKVREAAFAHLD